MPLNANWAKDLEAFGIPADRVKLVERNLALRVRLKARGDALRGVIDSLHKTFDHPGDTDECRKETCRGLLDVLRMTEPE